MMEIVVDGIVFENQAHGGVSRICKEIIPRICDLDSSVRFSLLTAGKLKQSLPTHSCVSHVSLPPIDRLIQPQRKLYSLRRKVRALTQTLRLRETQGKIWHSSYYTLPQNWSGQVVVTVFDMTHEHFPALFNREVDEQFRKHKKHCVLAADTVICISQSTKLDLIGEYDIDPSRIRVVPLAHTDSFFQREYREDFVHWPTDHPFLLYVGGRHHYKNFSLLMETFARWSRRESFDLVVVGPDWSPDERGFLASNRLTERVHLLAKVSDSQLCALYNHARAFVYPSKYEGFGIPLLEAMACGCPVVASSIPSSMEVAANCAVYFDPDSSESLQAAISEAIAIGRSSKRVANGIRRAREFSWDHTAAQTLEVYRSVNVT